jgi:hypothetical protein
MAGTTRGYGTGLALAAMHSTCTYSTSGQPTGTSSSTENELDRNQTPVSSSSPKLMVAVFECFLRIRGFRIPAIRKLALTLIYLALANRSRNSRPLTVADDPTWTNAHLPVRNEYAIHPESASKLSKFLLRGGQPILQARIPPVSLVPRVSESAATSPVSVSPPWIPRSAWNKTARLGYFCPSSENLDLELCLGRSSLPRRPSPRRNRSKWIDPPALTTANGTKAAPRDLGRVRPHDQSGTIIRTRALEWSSR